MSILRLILVGLVLTAAASVLLIVYSVTPPNETPCCTDSGLLSFELARSPEHAILVRDQPNVRESLRANVFADFAFVPAYGVLLGSLGWLLSRRQLPSARFLGLLALGLTSVLIVADVLENVAVLQVLNAAAPAADDVSRMRLLTLCKWLLLGLVALILVYVFIPAGGGSYARVLSIIAGMLFLIGGSLALWGVVATASWPGNDPALEMVFTPLVSGSFSPLCQALKATDVNTALNRPSASGLFFRVPKARKLNSDRSPISLVNWTYRLHEDVRAFSIFFAIARGR